MKEPQRVREPVQVYLAPPDRDRLASLAERLGLTKSEVLRRGLGALERETTDPSRHPLLELSGIATGEGGMEVDYDPVIEHDRYVADYVQQQTDERRAEIEAAERKGRRRRRG